uniref:Uncharacterized protein n=1 Tax=Fagus sylvatica TaxID=28930 RepID=A0A2N9I712_FAGSY
MDKCLKLASAMTDSSLVVSCDVKSQIKEGKIYNIPVSHVQISLVFHEMEESDPYGLLLNALALIPTWHYLLGFSIVSFVFLYNFLECHFFDDVFSGFRGTPITLTYNPCSHIYDGVVSKCRVLHGRYFTTPWLSSPHVQTVFLNFHGRPPAFSYRSWLGTLLSQPTHHGGDALQVIELLRESEVEKVGLIGGDQVQHSLRFQDLSLELGDLGIGE